MAKLEEIAVIGGGRWARILAETLYELVGSSTRITLYSEHCSNAVGEWLQARNLAGVIGVSSQTASALARTSTAVVVANAARDHEFAARLALNSAAPVLVEKPIALNGTAARSLMRLAGDTGGLLAAANVFLFAPYVEVFSGLLSTVRRRIRSIQLRWVDPASEVRYGDVKSYDAGLPVFKDVLPHVSAILDALLPETPQVCTSLRFLRGGAHLEIEIDLGGIPCNIVLARNGPLRERSIVVTLKTTETLCLDFAKEPGTITDARGPRTAVPDWHTHPRPLALMLQSFLTWITESKFDQRLSTDVALRACDLMDQVSSHYNYQLIAWLKQRIRSSIEDESLRYAADEILLSRGYLAPATLQQCRSRLLGADRNWINEVTTSDGGSVLTLPSFSRYLDRQ